MLPCRSLSAGGGCYTTRTRTCTLILPCSYFATPVLQKRSCSSSIPGGWKRSKPRTHYFSTTGDIVGRTGGATSNNMVEPNEPSCHHLAPYQMYKWRPNPELSKDENYMDMVLLLTRNSTCRQGHMACAIVKPSECPPTTNFYNSFYNSIQAVGINGPIFKPLDSDNHAEIATIGLAAKLGRALEGCTAYITMPPCKTCFGALVASGIQRIVTPKLASEPIVGAAKQHGIVLDTVHESQDRVMTYVLQDPEAIQADRQVRKERQERKKRKKEPQEEESTMT
jgi:deoxycytidylate deaminase